VSRENWIQARKAHLKNEKALTRMRDLVARERRELPWVEVEKTLAELFGINNRGRHKMHAADLGVGIRGEAMIINELKEFLIWSTVINYGVIFLWFGVFMFAHDWMYRMHYSWFRLSVETFNAIHYAGIAFYKIGVLLLNLVPLIVLLIIS
jgi:hypothetical protein